MIEITLDPLIPEDSIKKVTRDYNGAVLTFLGTTRSVTGDKNVLYL